MLTRKADAKARISLPADFANSFVTVERVGDELRIRKARKYLAQRYSLKELLAQVTPENVHAEVDFGPAVGREAL